MAALEGVDHRSLKLLETEIGVAQLKPQDLTLPSDWYFDPAIFRREHEAIFYRTWSYQGHATDLPKPNDFMCGSVADQQVFIIRGADGQLRAFHNVCSHRAHPLLSGNGNAKRIVCPYHQWCYRSNGRFDRARGVESIRNWNPRDADLKPVQLEEYGGLLFVNLDPTATSLRSQASGLLSDIDRMCPGLADMVRVKRVEQDVAANWKTLIDNNHECYHCSANHKSLMKWVDYSRKAVWWDDGITFTHTVAAGDNIAAPFDTGAGATVQDSLFGFIWPNTIPLFFPGSPSLVLFQIIPTGPETSRVRHDFYLSSATPTEAEQQFMIWVTDVLAKEDIELCKRVQQGLHSIGYRQGVFVIDETRVDISEHHVRWFQQFVRDALERQGSEN